MSAPLRFPRRQSHPLPYLLSIRPLPPYLFHRVALDREQASWLYGGSPSASKP
jgi:hypothetical protein